MVLTTTIGCLCLWCTNLSQAYFVVGRYPQRCIFRKNVKARCNEKRTSISDTPEKSQYDIFCCSAFLQHVIPHVLVLGNANIILQHSPRMKGVMSQNVKIQSIEIHLLHSVGKYGPGPIGSSFNLRTPLLLNASN